MTVTLATSVSASHSYSPLSAFAMYKSNDDEQTHGLIPSSASHSDIFIESACLSVDTAADKSSRSVCIGSSHVVKVYIYIIILINMPLFFQFFTNVIVNHMTDTIDSEC